MKFIFGGENWISQLERLTYRGTIGIFWNTTAQGIIAYALFAIICILALIGLIGLIRAIFGSKRKRSKKASMSAEDKWLKTGKM